VPGPATNVSNAVRQLWRIESVFDGRAGDLEKNRALLIDYCRAKMAAGDWHGVQDAASDIRDIDAKLEGLRESRALLLHLAGAPRSRPHKARGPNPRPAKRRRRRGGS